MRMRAVCWVALLGCAPVWAAPVPDPANWVPARWQFNDAKSLELLADSPINCLLLRSYSADLVSAASARGLVTLAVVKPGADPLADARKALQAKVNGIVLEGDFPPAVSAGVRDAAGAAP